jgi:hypothetical protein
VREHRHVLLDAACDRLESDGNVTACDDGMCVRCDFLFDEIYVDEVCRKGGERVCR